MTGVQSAQVLGPSTQKQADKSRQAIEGVDEDDMSFDASQNVEGHQEFGHTDGGQDANEKNNGLDVVRTNQ